MQHRQILSQTECVGKVIAKILTVFNDTFFLFTDDTFCIYNVNFYTTEKKFNEEYEHTYMVELGFMELAESVAIEKRQKEVREKHKKENDRRTLIELNAKYPNVLKTINSK